MDNEAVKMSEKQTHEVGYMNPTSMFYQQRQEEAEQMLEGAHEKGLNARQMMAQVKGHVSKGLPPRTRIMCKETPAGTKCIWRRIPRVPDLAMVSL